MMNLEFKTEHFYKGYGRGMSRKRAERWAAYCNEIVQGMLKTAKIVYRADNKSASGMWDEVPNTTDTHCAFLINEQAIVKLCNHEPRYLDQSYQLPDKIICKHCDIELVKKWEPK